MYTKITLYRPDMDESVRFFILQEMAALGFCSETSEKEFFGEDIQTNYMEEEGFWCLTGRNCKIYATIGLRKREDHYEIRHFFVSKKIRNKKYGMQLLNKALRHAVFYDVQKIKAIIMKGNQPAGLFLTNAGFTMSHCNNKNTSEICYKLDLSPDQHYKILYDHLADQHKKTLILNPTENIPVGQESYDTVFFNNMYVSERKKDLSDDIIFAGREDYIKFFEVIKREWKKHLRAYDVDLKTLSGLQAHMVLFICILKPGESVLLLPEICGGHYSTKKILESIGANVIEMVPDCKKLGVNQHATEALIKDSKPEYVFVDRSEGLFYEDFTWLNKFSDCFKIFDASQYLTQILTGYYPHPFDMGFDMVVSTLHKNYPGPQKGLICTQKNNKVWENYQANAKTYISSTHPGNIASSILPLLDIEAFERYSSMNILCSHSLEKELTDRGLPIVVCDREEPKTLHLWILCDTASESHNYFFKLEQLGLLTNYRKLPYELGYGLRIGTGAAVRSGLQVDHIPVLAAIMSEAYFGELKDKLRNKAKRLIREIRKSTVK